MLYHRHINTHKHTNILSHVLDALKVSPYVFLALTFLGSGVANSESLGEACAIRAALDTLHARGL